MTARISWRARLSNYTSPTAKPNPAADDDDDGERYVAVSR